MANAGDSRCVVSIKGRARDMSIDHKPTDQKELKRILAAGGRISSDGRINHGLNMSRALGNFYIFHVFIFFSSLLTMFENM